MTKTKNYPAGFTLIELLIVIAMLSILASSLIVLINPLAQFQKARDAQRKSDLRQIQSALEMYRSDNSSYPAALNSCSGKFGNFPTCSITYMSKIPADPKNSTINYVYTPSVAPITTYTLTACLENVNDPQGTGGTCSVAGGGSGINFQLTQP